MQVFAWGGPDTTLRVFSVGSRPDQVQSWTLLLGLREVQWLWRHTMHSLKSRHEAGQLLRSAESADYASRRLSLRCVLLFDLQIALESTNAEA